MVWFRSALFASPPRRVSEPEEENPANCLPGCRTASSLKGASATGERGDCAAIGLWPPPRCVKDIWRVRAKPRKRRSLQTNSRKRPCASNRRWKRTELAPKFEPPRGRALPLPYAPRLLRDRKPELEAATAPSSGEAELADAATELARRSGPPRGRGRPLPYVPRRLQHPVRDKEPVIRAEAATPPADFTAPSSHFGRKWLWRAASATSFGSAAAVIGILGLLLLQSPSHPHLLAPTHVGETAAQAATAAPRAVEADPVNVTMPPTGPTRAPADGAQPAAPKTYPSEASALPPVQSANPPESASPKTSEPPLPLPPAHLAKPSEPVPPNASPSERIRPIRNRLRHAERREGAAVGRIHRRVNRQEVVAGRPRRGR